MDTKISRYVEQMARGTRRLWTPRHTVQINAKSLYYPPQVNETAHMLYERLGFQIMVSDDGTARKRKRLYSHRRIDLNLRNDPHGRF